MRPPNEDTGFAPPATRPLGRTRRTVAMAELLAGIGLAAGTIVAATAITAGIARADGVVAIAVQPTASVSFALMIALLAASIGGLLAITLIGHFSRGRSRQH